MPELQRIERDQLGTVGDVTRQIFDGSQPGIVVRQALEPADCAAAVAALDAGAAEARRMGSYPGTTFGVVLLTADAMEPYFAAARELEAALPRAVLQGVHRTLKGLCPGHKLQVPRSKSGDFYAAVTARKLVPGKGIEVHSERSNWDSMAALRASVDLTTQVSFYALLQAPDVGGELWLYDGKIGEDGAADGDMSGRPHSVIDLEVGDLVVFDGGRYNHQVTPVGEGRARWTLGGFTAFKGSRQYFWS